MEWRQVLFANWPVDPDLVAARLPSSLSVDTYDGRAWLSVVPFLNDDVRPRGFPRFAGFSLPELNLRTYVRAEDGTRGIYFYNLDADDRLGVFFARTLFQLPYYRAEIDVEREGRQVRFQSRRVGEGEPAAFDATYGPAGDRFEAEPGSLPHFLTERYRFYTEGERSLFYGDIDHGPWPLAEATAEIQENDLFRVNGFEEPDGAPLLHYSPRVDVAAGRIHRV
jgi:uncharacterized protein YqjF (DUF2071 family)